MFWLVYKILLLMFFPIELVMFCLMYVGVRHYARRIIRDGTARLVMASLEQNSGYFNRRAFKRLRKMRLSEFWRTPTFGWLAGIVQPELTPAQSPSPDLKPKG